MGLLKTQDKGGMKITIVLEDKVVLNKDGSGQDTTVEINTDPPIDVKNKKHQRSKAVKMLGMFLALLNEEMHVDISNLEIGGKENDKTEDIKHRRKL